MKVADAVVAAAVVLMVVLVVDLAAATVEAATEAATATISRDFFGNLDQDSTRPVRRVFHRCHRNHRGRWSVVWKSYKPRDS